MNTLNIQTCGFCTFVNVPESKTCSICEKTLHLPVQRKPKVKVCPACSLFNETFYDTCKICGTELTNDSTSGIKLASGTSGSLSGIECEASGSGASKTGSTMGTATKPNAKALNSCSECCQKYPGNFFVKVCRVCTYYNLADTVQCLICATRYDSKQKSVLSRVCPFCNHDETAGMECGKCTFDNFMLDVHCAMCGDPLNKPTQSTDDQSSPNSIDEKLPQSYADSGGTEDYMDEKEEEFSMKIFRFKFAEGFSIMNEAVKSFIRAGPNVVASTSKADNHGMNSENEDCFELLEEAPRTHKYFGLLSEVQSAKFMRAVATNIEILKTSAPPGVWIKCYEDRMDLLSFMITGPDSTPYENGLFVFDIHLPPEFPMKPPSAHYISFWAYRLNPNLYVEGKVCVSLLGTWYAQREEEQWQPTSTLLQLIVSIQGLILVEQPYFNEPGYANQHGTPEGFRNSEMYNEGVIVGMIESTTAMINDPPPVFKKDIYRHFSKCGAAMYERFQTVKDLMENPPSLRQLERFLSALDNNVNGNVK